LSALFFNGLPDLVLEGFFILNDAGTCFSKGLTKGEK